MSGFTSTYPATPENGNVRAIPHMRELAALVTDTGRTWQSLRRVQYGPGEAEKASARFRRWRYTSPWT